MQHIAPVSFHMIDWLLQSQAFDLHHYLFPFMIYLIYAIFNCIVTLSTGNIIYSTNDWVNTPGLALGFTLFIFLL